MVKGEQIVSEVHAEWTAAGKLHDPPDDTSHDDDLGFWNEVQRRQRESELGDLAGEESAAARLLADE